MAVLTREIKQGANRIAAMEFLDDLRTGELIDSVSEISITRKPTDADDLTIGSPAVLAAEMEINGREAAIGQGFTFTIDAADDQALGRYVLHGVVTTDSTPAQDIPFCLTVVVLEC